MCVSEIVRACVLRSQSLVQLFLKKAGPEIFTAGPERPADAHKIVKHTRHMRTTLHQHVSVAKVALELKQPVSDSAFTSFMMTEAS